MTIFWWNEHQVIRSEKIVKKERNGWKLERKEGRNLRNVQRKKETHLEIQTGDLSVEEFFNGKKPSVKNSRSLSLHINL